MQQIFVRFNNPVTFIIVGLFVAGGLVQSCTGGVNSEIEPPPTTVETTQRTEPTTSTSTTAPAATWTPLTTTAEPVVDEPIEPAEVEPEPEVEAEPPTADHEPTTDVEAWVCSYDWDCAGALRVMYCESGDPLRRLGEPSILKGAWQIDWITHRTMILDWSEFYGLGRTIDGVFDIRVNTEVAYSLSRGGTDWGAFPTCGARY